jgi:hypothetical protein
LNGVAVTAPFDHTRLTVTGPPTPLTEDFRQSRARSGKLWPFVVSGDGSLAFIPGGRPSQRSLVWVDRHEVETPLGTALHAYERLRLSPDGQRLALIIKEPTGLDIWIHDLAYDRLTRLTSEGKDSSAVWSPDGKRIAFASRRSGPSNMFVRAADGSGPTERLLTSDKEQWPSSWSSDGRTLIFTQDEPMPDIWMISMDQPRTSSPIVQLPGYQTSSRISPDGRWLAYGSEESGQSEVFVTSLPNAAGKWQVSSGGGTQPVWARSGLELFYVNGDQLMVTAVDAHSGFAASKPALLFQGGPLVGIEGDATYDVSLDGQRFVMIRTSGERLTNQVNVVLGWTDELARREREVKP